jgi:hypothetical protein
MLTHVRLTSHTHGAQNNLWRHQYIEEDRYGDPLSLAPDRLVIHKVVVLCALAQYSSSLCLCSFMCRVAACLEVVQGAGAGVVVCHRRRADEPSVGAFSGCVNN